VLILCINFCVILFYYPITFYNINVYKVIDGLYGNEEFSLECDTDCPADCPYGLANQTINGRCRCICASDPCKVIQILKPRKFLILNLKKTYSTRI